MSVGHVNPDSANVPAAGRLIVAVAALILVGSGLSAGSDSSPEYSPERRLSAEAYQITSIVVTLSESLADNQSPELAMAWEDLRSDLESVSRDLESARFSVDVDGLVDRVGSFRREFANVNGMGEEVEVWDQLSNLLKDLASHSR